MPTYRYTLERILEQPTLFAEAAIRTVLFCMLNPSTATATTNDPTVRRCIGFGRAWGFPRLEVVNMYAARSTDPNELPRMIARQEDPIGPENDRAIADAAQRSDLVIAAWGSHPAAVASYGGRPPRARVVEAIIAGTGHDLYALKLSKDGNPYHPLYTAGDLKPILYRKAA